MTATILFVVQVVCSVWSGGAAFVRLLHSTQGVTTSWFVCWEVFNLLNVTLAWRAYQESKRIGTTDIMSRLYTLLSYSLWTVLIALDLAVKLNGEGKWDGRDTATMVIAFCSIPVAVMIGRGSMLGVKDPLVRGILAAGFKGLPQLMLAAKIHAEGGSGLPWGTVLSGHITIFTRLIPMVIDYRRMKVKDKHMWASIVSEIANSSSWTIVTIVWW